MKDVYSPKEVFARERPEEEILLGWQMEFKNLRRTLDAKKKENKGDDKCSVIEGARQYVKK